MKWQTSVTVQIQLSFIWQAKEDTSPRCKGQPKRRQRLDFGSSFYIFCLLLLSLPCVNLASQEGCLFYLRSSLQSSDLLLFYFCRLSPSLSFSHSHFGLLFPILTTQHCSVQFNSVTQSCPTLCNPMNHSTPGLPVHHQHPEFTQTHVHRVGDAIQPSHPLSSPSPPALNLSQHQGLFQ